MTSSRAGHSYKLGLFGRSISSKPGVGGPTVKGQLRCSHCHKQGQVTLAAHMPPEVIDKKFRQSGWLLDPHNCPDCIRKISTKRKDDMASKPSPAAMVGQFKMFQLLTERFNPEAGAYDEGWSDAKISTESGIAHDAVIEFRRANLGELKEPDVIQKLRADIVSLTKLAEEQSAEIQRGIAELRRALGKASERYLA